MRNELVLVKLGGSVITFKDKSESANLPVIRRLTFEIGEAFADFRLIVVHGGGSFGHPYAYRYSLQNGFKSAGQLVGVCETHLAMERLNKLIIDEFLSAGIPALPLQSSASIHTISGEISSFNLDPLRIMLKLGLLPVFYGDVVFDESDGFRILSGDRISSYLAVHLGVKRLVFASDVDGVFTSDPKSDSSARLIDHLSVDEIGSLRMDSGLDNGVVDVTGGMAGKLREAAYAASNGVEVCFVNAFSPGRLLKAIRGEDFFGTVLTV